MSPLVFTYLNACPCFKALFGGDFGAFRWKSIAGGRMSLQEVSENLQPCPHCIHFLSVSVVTAIISSLLDLATCSHAFLTLVDSPSGTISLKELFLSCCRSWCSIMKEQKPAHMRRRFSFSCASPYKPSF